MTRHNDNLQDLKHVTQQYIHTALDDFDDTQDITTVFVLDHEPLLQDFEAIRKIAEIRNISEDQFRIIEFEIIDKNTTTATPHYATIDYPQHWKHFHYYLDFKPKRKETYI